MEEVAEELAQVGVVGLVVEPQGAAEVEVCGELSWRVTGTEEATVRPTLPGPQQLSYPPPSLHFPSRRGKTKTAATMALPTVMTPNLPVSGPLRTRMADLCAMKG